MIPRFRPTLFLSDLPVLFQRKGSIEEFETIFSDFVGWKYGILFPYGRAAAYSFFLANNVRDKEIIIPAYNCRAMLSAVIGSTNRPAFVDCEENSVNMDSKKALRRVHQDTGAICPTAMYGFPFEADPYKGVSDRVLVLADLCLGLFEETNGIQHYDGIHAAFFSLGIGKQTTILGGGMLCTNDMDIYQRVKDYRDNHFNMESSNVLSVVISFLAYRVLFSPLLYRLLYLLSEKTNFLNSLKGLEIGVDKILPDDFFAMPNAFQVKLGLRQFERMHRVKERREAIINCYDRAFRSDSLRRIDLLPINPHCSHYPVFTDDRDELADYLVRRGIHATNIFQSILPELPLAKDYRGRESYPHAVGMTQRCLLLPLNDLMTEAEQNHIIHSVLTWDHDRGS